MTAHSTSANPNFVPKDDRADIQSTPLNVAGCQQFLSCPKAGGQVIFIGTVRRFTDTRNTGYVDTEDLGQTTPQETANQSPKVIETIALEYDAYRPLAVRAINQLIAETRDRFQLNRVLLEHRIGRVEIGEPAILIGASSQHRRQAFQAVEFLIDQVKTRIPVWKREILVDGSSHWVHPKPKPFIS